MVNALQSSLQRGATVQQEANSARTAQRCEASIQDPAGVAIHTCMWHHTNLSHKPIYLHTHMQQDLNLTLCASNSTWSTTCPNYKYVYDLDTRLNHTAEASQVDLYRPRGANSHASINKHSAVRPCFSALFHIPSRHTLSHVVQFPVSRKIHYVHRAQARASVPAIIVAPKVV